MLQYAIFFFLLSQVLDVIFQKLIPSYFSNTSAMILMLLVMEILFTAYFLKKSF